MSVLSPLTPAPVQNPSPMPGMPTQQVYPPVLEPASTSFQATTDTFTLATKTPPPLDNNQEMPYSVAKMLIDSKQLQGAEIKINPTSISDIPYAELKLINGEKRNVMLPRETDDFLNDLEAAGIPYSFESSESEGIAKVGTWAGNILKEMFGPFLLMAGTLGLGAQGYKRFQQKQAMDETREAIHKAHKDLKDYPHAYADVLQNHDPGVQEALNSFLRNERSVLIAKGYPGLGKTHTLLALAKDVAHKDSGVMTLEVRPGVGDNVRALLRDVYSGDKDKAVRAIATLNKENNGPVREILLYADEIEKVASDEMKDLLVNGIHNPDSTVAGLPKLRMLATCNTYPSFINDSAVNSRISSILITPPGADVNAHIFASALEKGLAGKTLPPNLPQLLQPIFEEYAGYSPRTITQSVAKAVITELQMTPTLNAEAITTTVSKKLAATPLNNTEMASVIIKMITKNIMNGHQPLDAVQGPANLWRILGDNAETHTAGINFLVSLNGKQAQGAIQELLQGVSLDYTHGVTDLNTAVETVAHGLKSKRLDALRVQNPHLNNERQLASEFREFLEMQISAGAKKETLTDTDHSVTQNLQKLAKALKHIDRNSEAGESLAKATRLYEDILTETDPQAAPFMTKEKLEALFRRVFNFDPAIHTAQNDFGLIADNRYTSMFYHLKDMTGKLLRHV